jgi:hypothetical protein
LPTFQKTRKRIKVSQGNAAVLFFILCNCAVLIQREIGYDAIWRPEDTRFIRSAQEEARHHLINKHADWVCEGELWKARVICSKIMSLSSESVNRQPARPLSMKDPVN